jgi:Mg-chelatase subunit ChlD
MPLAIEAAVRRVCLLIIVVMVLSFINCSPVQFTKMSRAQNLNREPENLPSSNGENAEVLIPKPGDNPQAVQCTQDYAKMPIKVLFVVDTSGSNSTTYNGSKGGSCAGRLGCVPATDPQKTFRGGSISEFFEKYKDRPNFSWGFETFSKDSVLSYIGQNANALFGNSIAMESAIDAFSLELDRGKTPYLKALEGIQTAIANDSDLHSTAEFPPLYYVVFMSDGYPTDSNRAQIRESVEKIVSLDPARISLSTIYYGTQNDPEASGTLENMATVGGGQFVNFDTNSNETIDIQDLISLPTTTCK